MPPIRSADIPAGFARINPMADKFSPGIRWIRFDAALSRRQIAPDG
jgi:hypothetical protein